MIQINAAAGLPPRVVRMRDIVDETGEIVAKAADDHTLIGDASPPPRRWRPASVKTVLERYRRACGSLIPSSREVCIYIQLDAKAT